MHPWSLTHVRARAAGGSFGAQKTRLFIVETLLSNTESSHRVRACVVDLVDRRGGGAGPPPTPERSSKLPPINPGVNPYEAELEPEKTPFEKLIFNGTWVAIFFLVAVEIFINTPLFQQIQPAVLNFLAGN